MSAAFDFGFLWLIGLSATLIVFMLKGWMTLFTSVERSMIMCIIGAAWFIIIPLMLVNRRVRTLILEQIGDA
jgi:tetrahydromethanopterin S-methyltransferase subunit E